MTLRLWMMFVLFFVVVVLGEWLVFFRGYDFSTWPVINWTILVGALIAEAVAIYVITATVDRAMPAAGNRAPSPSARNSRRGRR